MTNFKYSMYARYTNSTIAVQFIENLLKLQYIKELDRNPENYNCIWINSPKSEKGLKNGAFAVGIMDKVSDHSERDYEFNIDNKWEYEAALAIAAIRDDDKPYVGEWVFYKEIGCLNMRRDIPHKINKVINDNINIEGYKTTNLNGTTDMGLCRKATPEEIIAYMKEKYSFYGAAAFEQRHGRPLIGPPTFPEKWAIKGPIWVSNDLLEFFRKEIDSKTQGGFGLYYHFDKSKKSIHDCTDQLLRFGYTEINYHQWKAWYDYQQQSTKNQQVMELPKNWCIRGGEELAGFIEEQEIKLGVNTRITGEHDDQYYWLNSPENFTSWSWYISIPSNRELVSFKQFEEWYNQQTMNKNKDKKVIGYKLIKEYPGAFVKLHETVITNGTKIGEQIQKGRNETRDIIYSDYPEFWEPIYEAEKRETVIRIECSDSFNVIVEKGSNYIKTSEGNVDIERLKQLKAVAGSPTNKIGDWDLKINTVDIGCKKNIPFRYLDEIIKAWEELNT